MKGLVTKNETVDIVTSIGESTLSQSSRRIQSISQHFTARPWFMYLDYIGNKDVGQKVDLPIYGKLAKVIIR